MIKAFLKVIRKYNFLPEPKSTDALTRILSGKSAFASILFASLLMSACISMNDWATKISWDDIDLSSLPQKEDFQDAPAVMLLNHGKIEIFALNENKFSVFDRHQVIRIFDQRGYKYANIMIPYGSQSTVESIRARTISPSGEITVLEPEKIYDVNLYPDFVFYSDQRAKIFTLPAIEDGCLIEYRYSLSINSSTYGNLWRFQHDIPVLHSRFTLLKPAEWEIDYRLYDIELEPEIIKAPAGFKTSLVWDVYNMPGLKYEIAMPPANEIGARLQLSSVTMRSWSEVSRWYNSLLQPQSQARGDLEQIAQKITEKAVTDKDKLRKIYEWTRDRIRYIAVSVGIGGYQPNPVVDVLHNKYGDCKDMTTLMCALADEAGLEMYPALISTRNNGIPDTSLASISQFNHIIAYCPSIDENELWLDATDKICAFGQLPWYDQGVPVLPVIPDYDGKIVFTPRIPADSNRSVMSWLVTLDSTGAAGISGCTVYKGAVANEIRQTLYFASENERRRWLEFYLASRCSGALLDTFSIHGLNPVSDSIFIDYVFTTPSFAQRYHNMLTFQPSSPAAFDLPDYFRSTDRIYPVQFQFPSISAAILKIQIPEGWITETESLDDSLVYAQNRASWELQAQRNTIYSKCEYLMDMEMVDPAEYTPFREFLDKIRQNDLRQVVLKKLR